jgi:hypothetical protein
MYLAGGTIAPKRAAREVPRRLAAPYDTRQTDGDLTDREGNANG